MKQENKLAKTVRQKRLAKGWSQAHLADITSVDERTIRRIESGEVTPSLETLQAVAQAFDMTCEELKDLTAEGSKPKAKLQLVPISTGTQFFDALADACAGGVDADETQDPEEADLVTSLLDSMEYREVWDEMTPGQRYEQGLRVSSILRRLIDRGWGVCVARRTKTLHLPSPPPGSGLPEPLAKAIPNWVTVTVRVMKIPAHLSDEFQRVWADALDGAKSSNGTGAE